MPAPHPFIWVDVLREVIAGQVLGAVVKVLFQMPTFQVSGLNSCPGCPPMFSFLLTGSLEAEDDTPTLESLLLPAWKSWV